MFRPDIEGLRAIAVLAVVAYHAHAAALPGGYVGVDLFFTISGYLITALLLREVERTGTVSLPRFVARRARRLLPAAALVLAAVTLAAGPVLGSVRAAPVYTDGIWAASFAANLRFAALGTDYLGSQTPPSPLQHYWSLAVEEQFYLVWPAVVVVVAAVARRHTRAALTVAAAAVLVTSLAWSMHQSTSNPSWAYFSPATRAFELAGGALVALAAPALTRLVDPDRTGRGAALGRRAWAFAPVAGLAMIADAAATYDETTVFPGSAAVLPCLGGALVIAGGLRGVGAVAGPARAVQTVLSVPPLQLLGKLSYSWYLWHWPVLLLTEAHLGHPLTVGQALGCVAVSLALAAATYVAVENPVRHARRIAASTVRSVGLGAALTGLCVAGNVVGADLSSTRSQDSAAVLAQRAARADTAPLLTEAQVRAQVATAANRTTLSPDALVTLPATAADDFAAERGTCQAERSTTTLPGPEECRFGDRSAPKTVVLFGDSHATMWLPALDLLGRRDHVAVVLLAKSACPAASLSVWDASRNRAYPECDTWRRAALDRVAELKPDLVVLSSQGAIGGVAVDGELAATDTEQAWSEGLTATLTAVRRTGARAVVLGDIPFLSRPAPSCLPLHIDDVGACARPAAQAVPAAHNAMERTTAARNRAGYLDVTSWLCTDTVCPAAIAGIVSYYNLRHVSASYARHLAGPLGSQLQLADL